ncbi:hypothetical protein E2562_039192 [Oryza meyeriana var. granulata]|uniref:Uncharacterized protein n=1 Tax=Oryza meyeriana var. granulata TaxID=110450 RepID=A0A6G1C3D7_9ORYZ|nr:hypothetical protein E2562_039192 [Oryza meyeriana var. granulata]
MYHACRLSASAPAPSADASCGKPFPAGWPVLSRPHLLHPELRRREELVPNFSASPVIHKEAIPVLKGTS